MFLIEVLSNLNLKYIFTGNYKIWIGGKNPDFINETDKKIIEFFGWWHTKDATKIPDIDTENNRITHFFTYGYKCLILWDKDLQDIESLKDKLLSF